MNIFMILINLTNNNHQDVHLRVDDDRGGLTMQSWFEFVIVSLLSLYLYSYSIVFEGRLTMRSGQRPLGAAEAARNQFSSCCRTTREYNYKIQCHSANTNTT